jgi:AraC-like DNA-binding protein
MRGNMSTTTCRTDSGWGRLSTIRCETLEHAEVTVTHATLDAGHAASLGPCPEHACTVILHLTAVDLFQLHARKGLLRSGHRPAGAATVVPGPQAFSVNTSERMEVLIVSIPRLPLIRIAPELRPKRGEQREAADGAYDPVGHKLGLALLPALQTPDDQRPRSTTHLVRAICYHFVLKHAWAQEKFAGAAPGLAPWQALKAETLLERGDLQVREVAAACELSPRHFTRLFRATFRCSPHAFLVERRVDGLKRLLLDTDVSLADAAVQLGFADQASMSRSFRQVVGVSPGVWRASQHQGSAIPLPSP